MRKKKLAGFFVMSMFLFLMGLDAFGATIGQQLGSPEPGWIRFDDTDSKIVYGSISNWVVYPNTMLVYNSTLRLTKVVGEYATFKFYGTKFRLVCQGGNAGSQDSKNSQITIDGDSSYVYNSGVTANNMMLIFEKTGLPLGVHTVTITCKDGLYISMDAIDIDDTGYLVDYNTPSAPTNLTASASSTKVDLTWGATTGTAITYNVKRSDVAGGPYTTIATTSAISFSDESVTGSTTYYYVVSAVNSYGEGGNSNEVSTTSVNPVVSLDITSVDKASVGNVITANIVIHNANNICAEDIKIIYDTAKLDYIGTDNVSGMKIYKEDAPSIGTQRYITACLGKANAANGDKILLKLKFKAKAIGEAKIDIVNGRIADNATLETDIAQINCGEKTVLIEAAKDVNRSGEFTLLDLGIDAWYYGDAVSAIDSAKYDADVIANGTIDDDDLIEIVQQMLNNINYLPNAS